jgi:site-specific DNA-cytosine methylase
MANKTVGCLAGGAGCGAWGAILAGYSPSWSIDIWDVATQAYIRNLGRRAYTADLLEAEPSEYRPVDVIIASPSCCSYSNANVHGSETQQDIAISDAIGRWIYQSRPGVVLIENVVQYEGSKAQAALFCHLQDADYTIDALRANAIDYGCTQNRRRFYAIAYNPKVVSYRPPMPTHGKGRLPHLGWGTQLMGRRDLLVSLQEDRLTPVMIAPIQAAGSLEPILITRVGYRKAPAVWPMSKPMGTIRASLADDGKTGRSKYLTLWVPDRAAGDPLLGVAYNISTSALAALMGLPKWQWTGNNTDDVRLIGNGIIPKMVQTILQQIVWH